jgi:hypothetical protein
VRSLEMLRQQREAQEQAEQIRDRDPLVSQALGKAGHAGPFGEPGEHELVESDDDEAPERDRQRVMVEHRDAGEHEPEQHGIEGHTEARDGNGDR